MRGIQLTGTGVMTSRANVTAITLVSNGGHPLRVIKANQSYCFDSADALTGAANNSLLVSGTVNPASGTVVGNPDFVVSEVPGADLDRFTADLSWACSSSGGTAKSAALGYQFTLASIGLVVPQRVVMRPRFDATPKRIEWELYGDPRAAFTTPVQVTTEGHAFALDLGGASIDGVVLSTSNTSASVRLDVLQYRGVDVGTVGTYTFAVE